MGVEGARPPDDPHEPLQLQIGFDAEYKPVRLGPGAQVDTRFGGWAQLSARLNDLVSIFAQLPVVLHQSGDLSAYGTTQPVFGFSVGDVRFGARHSFLRGPIDLAGQISFEGATAPQGAFTGDQRLVFETLFAAAHRRGDWELIGNLYVRFRPPRDVGPAQLGNEIGLRGGIARTLSARARAYGELEVQTSLRGFSQEATPAEWRAGATVCVSPAFAFDVAAGTRLDDGLGAPSFRGIAAMRFAPSFCSPPKRETGPDPAIRELVSQIAKERAEREKSETGEKLPALVERSESDAREVLIRSQTLTLLPKSEADAVARGSAYAEEDTRDSDGDGVPDRLDNCPSEKGPKENSGCPPAAKQIVQLREDQIAILEKVYFQPGKTLIHPRSTRLLNQIAAVLKAHPELAKIEVQGHTDSKGGTAMNLALSQARSEAVVGALIRRGVAARRLSARGFGLSRPIETNANVKGREKNRRVEFRVVQRMIGGEIVTVQQ